MQQELNALTSSIQRNKRISEALRNFAHVSPDPVPESAPKRRKPNEPIKDEVKAIIIDQVFEQDLSYDQVAVLNQVHKSSVERIIRKEKERRKGILPAPPKKRGRRSNISVDALIRILDAIEEDATITLKELVQLLKTEMDIDTSKTAIHDKLEKLEYSYKNVLPIPINWNTTENKRKRQEFLSQVAMFPGRILVFIDESGFHLHIKRSKGRAPKGEKAVLKLVPKGKRISLIGALSERGYEHFKIFKHGDHDGTKKGVNAEDFRGFLLDLAPKIRDAVIVLDNARIHHSQIIDEVWPMLKSHFNIDHVFLPPYSPFLNPIEHSFNTIKSFVRRQDLYNKNDLVFAIERAVEVECTLENATGWFRNCQKYHRQCGLGLDFKGSILNPEILTAAIAPLPNVFQIVAPVL